MYLKRLELNGFKSFAHASEFVFDVPIIAIVGPNGSGKSNVVEAIRFVLGEQSVKSMRGKSGADMIFKGSKEVAKKSRASVSITFDNTKRIFSIGQSDNTSINVDFDEISIGREVFADGSNVYSINGTEVRMKDVHELIASINIGSSGHHIISQGEADRYLNANAKDRRGLIEEALGLRVYQYRLKESLRKLERARDNLRETELLRREIAPHLRFLKRQVEKIERAKEIRTELSDAYTRYFAQEDHFITLLSEKIDADTTQVQKEYASVQEVLGQHKGQEEEVRFPEEQTLVKLQQQLGELQSQRQHYSREMGRIEGMVAVLSQAPVEEEQQHYSREQVVSFANKVLAYIDSVVSSDQSSIDTFLKQLRVEVSDLLQSKKEVRAPQVASANTEQLKKEQAELTEKIDAVNTEEEALRASIYEAQESLERARKEHQEHQKTYYEYIARKKELEGMERLLMDKRASLAHRKEDMDNEYKEAQALLGMNEFPFDGELDQITDEAHHQLRREIERSKIRLEDMGGGSGIDTINEYQETLERDEFLEKEMVDVSSSIESLHTIIDELKQTLNTEFDAGIKKINVQFNNFFTLMFGGGSARLEEAEILKRKAKASADEDIVEEEEEEGGKEYGIDISVSLPRKKVSDLDMLSGGERSLTSIALLFALSQVNPPPFLVLDETDAALDEANSQKYGDMIESLSAYSQLILVTHNRETMSRAHTLFGITLGRDDASTMLSLRLEDAQQYAK